MLRYNQNDCLSMNILLVNKFHYPRDGVTTHYFELARLLQAHGHRVAFFSTANPKNIPTPWSKYFVRYRELGEHQGLWSGLSNAYSLIYNGEAKRNLRALLKEFKPDIVHLHNIYYHLTPSIIDEFANQGIPMVMTLHDYKLISPHYNLFLNNKIWEKSKPHRFWAVIKDRAIKHSYSKSAIAALEQYIHYWRKSYDNISLFISPSTFLKNKFKEYGFTESIEVLPNPVVRRATSVSAAPKEYFLYYGRLAGEKGIMIILEALARSRDFSLVIAGNGPQRHELVGFVENHRLKDLVTFAGFVQGRRLTRLIQESRGVIVPSLWYENFPYTVLESLAQGKLVLASSIGGIPELIRDGQNGLLFTPGDPEALHHTILRAKKLGPDPFFRQAIESVANYQPGAYYKKLMQLYKKAMRND